MAAPLSSPAITTNFYHWRYVAQLGSNYFVATIKIDGTELFSTYWISVYNQGRIDDINASYWRAKQNNLCPYDQQNINLAALPQQHSYFNSYKPYCNYKNNGLRYERVSCY